LGATSSLEREFKLSAPARFRLPRLDTLDPGVSATPEDVQRFTSVYWDTEDLRLTRWSCGLRHRTSDGWTVKLAAAEDGPAVVRREFRLGGAPQQPPEAALDLVLALSRGAPLRPIARFRTIRRRVRLLDSGGRELAQVTNDHVAVFEDRRITRRFREVEVELAGHCPPAIAESVLSRLRRAGSGPAHRIAKHERALGLESGVVPEVTLPSVGPEDAAGEVVRLALADSVRALVRHDAGVRADEDLEDVHQMRVATRRLRSHLRTFLPLLEADWTQALRADLQELGTALGRVRDADVLRERLSASQQEIPDLDRRAVKDLLESLEATREPDFDRLLRLLRSPEYLSVVERLIEAARTPRLRAEAHGPALELLAPLVRKRWKRLARGVARLDEPPSETDLHAVRIRAKHVRYAAEAVIPVYGRPARRFARAARRVQQVLGDHQDAVVAAAWLRDTATRVGRDAAFAAGALAAREARVARESLEQWREVWRAASERGRRDWLRRALSIRPD
jgi:CHAD domain-containing protein